MSRTFKVLAVIAMLAALGAVALLLAGCAGRGVMPAWPAGLCLNPEPCIAFEDLGTTDIAAEANGTLRQRNVWYIDGNGQWVAPTRQPETWPESRRYWYMNDHGRYYPVWVDIEGIDDANQARAIIDFCQRDLQRRLDSISKRDALFGHIFDEDFDANKYK